VGRCWISRLGQASPGTRGVDLTRKLAADFQVPSIQHYLEVWADRRCVIHHRRRNDGGEIDKRIVTGGEIALDPPGLTIAVADIYAD
jgi:hypothetical protein